MSTAQLSNNEMDDRMDTGQKAMIGLVAAVVVIGGYVLLTPNSPTDGESVKEQQPTPVAAAMKPVSANGKTYTLGSVEWVFEKQDVGEDGAPSTRVRLKLVDFKRDTTPIDVALYRLGTYRGECESFDVFGNARAVPDAGALAFAQCWWDASGRQLAVFQEDQKLVVKVRSVSEDDEQLAELTPILTIDIPTIVQPGK
jgi:hypothetical protein